MATESKLLSFLHLVKRSGVIKLGSDFLQESNLSRIKLVLISDEISALSKESILNFTYKHTILAYTVSANIVTSLYPGKNVRVLTISNVQVAQKIANLMKEGESYE